MKIKLLYSIIIAALLTSHSGKAEDYQLPYSNADIPGTTAYFSRSVFSNGIGSFLKEVFNNPSYPRDFWPNNCLHMIELLEYGNKTSKDQLYPRTVIRLFSDKTKASSYVNAYTFSDLLGQLPTLLNRYFALDTDRTMTSLRDIIYEIQYHSFRVNFPEFKSNPETFLTNLSKQIEDAAELRKVLVVFLEISLNKLIWSPEDQFDTWLTTKLIADQLACLYKRTMITDLDDLNSLCITLLERYCLFLDIAGSHIDISTFEKIKADIQHCQTPLLSLAEQEDLLETKMQRFTRCLIELEAKARARATGMVLS